MTPIFYTTIYFTYKEGATIHHTKVPYSSFRLRYIDGVNLIKKYIGKPIHSFAFSIHRWDEMNGWNPRRISKRYYLMDKERGTRE